MNISSAASASDIADIHLASAGAERVDWADQHMPILRDLRRRFSEEKPFDGMRVGACLHVTAETANLLRALQDGGAAVALCASNSWSTQDDVAACLVADYGIAVFARHGESKEDYYRALSTVLETAPTLALDDGGDLVSLIHRERPDLLPGLRGATEQTTTGVHRLRAMARAGALRCPVLAVNDSDTKHLFNNRYGTGQSAVDAIIRATNVLLAGRTLVVIGYGWAGRGIASRAAGLGAIVVVAEVSPVRALEALLDGHQVMPMARAAQIGDLFVSASGSKHVVTKRHFNAMKDGAIVCNCGHFDVELDLPGLRDLARDPRPVRPFVEEYRMLDGRRLYLLGEGRLINFTAGEGHPPAVMDMSLANQALACELLAKGSPALEPGIHRLPPEFDDAVARLKLESLGVEIDELTTDQEDYLASWEQGT